MTRWGARLNAALATLVCCALGTAIAPAQAAGPSGAITVSAASSLTDVLPAIARAFAQRYPGTSVRFNFAGSSTLVEQVLAGAPVDVLATASEQTMSRATATGQADTSRNFAQNTMAIITPVDNPAHVSTVRDLSRPGTVVALCAAAAPCGSSASALLAKNATQVTPATLEPDVRSVLAKVVAGEVDAGVVYATDARAAGTSVHTVRIAAADNVTTSYPIAAITASTNPVTARAFADYVRTAPVARRLLLAYGFLPPR